MSKPLRKLAQATGFAAFFIWELILANVRVAYDVMRPTRELQPGVVAVPLELETDWQITILSNLITLTPGTLSLDVSSDRKVIYIHAMNASDAERCRAEIKQGFERRVRELFS